MKFIYILPTILFASVLVAGFSLDKAIVPRSEIMGGGPPKDGIPALLEPKFVAATEAKFLSPQDQVIGVVLNGQPKAYPIKILSWHEVVNDEIDEKAFVVTY